MNETFMAGVAGAVSDLIFGGSAALLLMLTPLPAAYPESAPVVANVAVASLTIAGAGVGVMLSRLSRRRPPNEPEADYNDSPPAA